MQNPNPHSHRLSVCEVNPATKAATELTTLATGDAQSLAKLSARMYPRGRGVANANGPGRAYPLGLIYQLRIIARESN